MDLGYTDYVDEVVHDEELVLLGVYVRAKNDWGMVISHFDGNSFTNYQYMSDDIPFIPTAIAYGDDHYYITGHNSLDTTSVIIALNSDFDIEWSLEYRFHESNDPNRKLRWSYFEDLTIGRGDELVVSGQSVHWTDWESDGFIMKTDYSGTPFYQRYLGENGVWERFDDIYIASDGTIITVGKEWPNQGFKTYIAKSDFSGNQECEWIAPEVWVDEFSLERDDVYGEWVGAERPIEVELYPIEVELEQVDVCDPSIKVNYGDDAEVYAGFSIAPNPAETSIDISFALEEEAQVSLAVYDMTGRKVVEVFGGERLASGPRAETVDLKGLPSGIYNVVLEYGGKRITNKLSIIK